MTTSATDSNPQTGVPAGGHYVHRLVLEFLDARQQDCMELMAEYPDGHFDLAIVDPPYGIGISGQKESKRGKQSDRKHHEDKGWDKAIPSAEYFRELKRVSRHQIIWGANYFVEHLMHGSKGWIIWDKGQHGLTMSDCELAYSSFDRATRIKIINRVELLKEGTIHPTQKPVRLYKWLLANYAEAGWRILDTHLGSGSIAVACNDARLHLTACEIDEDYFKAACARIERETAQESFIFPNIEMKPILPEPITFFVPGQPKAQPRPRLGKGGHVYNPTTADGWKTHIWAFGHGAIKTKLAGPISVTLEFHFARPQDHFHYYKKADKGIPTKAAPQWHAVKPDTDNIAKAVLDALTPARGEKKFGRVNIDGQVESWGAWYDDCQVAELIVRKRYATDAGDGCRITIARLPENNDQH